MVIPCTEQFFQSGCAGLLSVCSPFSTIHDQIEEGARLHKDAGDLFFDSIWLMGELVHQGSTEKEKALCACLHSRDTQVDSDTMFALLCHHTHPGNYFIFRDNIGRITLHDFSGSRLLDFVHPTEHEFTEHLFPGAKYFEFTGEFKDPESAIANLDPQSDFA